MRFGYALSFNEAKLEYICDLLLVDDNEGLILDNDLKLWWPIGYTEGKH